ncbi:hypothetical protein MLD38_013465 [Melastoma candidum]|uniref:Uncharacterized protein n=1 Tax=Melastoma candidum TaxID=119954 RepID=A0ACB9R9N2_9MYRT|nr:hypothetical protein MLD38_013465 [Melastoma candidum]
MRTCPLPPCCATVDEVLTVLPKTYPVDLRSVTGRYFANVYSGFWCFGHASCNDSLADGDCTQCVTMAAGYLREACPSSIGGQMQLPQCRGRYEPYDITE